MPSSTRLVTISFTDIDVIPFSFCQTIIEGVIALFDTGYFIKRMVAGGRHLFLSKITCNLSWVFIDRTFFFQKDVFLLKELE
jgi:hypothetical protein